ncbi:neck protein [Gordonia phage Gustav]|uniref:Head-to-tail connector protein n=1 Tax=Gordonia phage Gustav TaxID=2047872 RepID=A0A2H4PAG9_9CAUD|nr:neck protein [Gordonia phage Gustav]ATW59069.1 hypothetical protein PHIRE_GUSTAV_9 [Gordonia phage Gustav]
MARPGFKLDRRGVSQLLKGDLGRAATDAANKVADQIRADYPDMAADVDVEAYTTDRGAASVMVKNSGARELQVREGLMTKAAAKVGLEVKAK